MLDVLKDELNVAIYCRLSIEDGDSGESNSIKTQREILVDYVEKNNWNIYNIYADDGYSGGNFNRPGWQRLINDVESGIINIVIVKVHIVNKKFFASMYLEVLLAVLITLGIVPKIKPIKQNFKILG